MPDQNMSSESVFLIAIAIIAGIVFISMMVLTFVLLRSKGRQENKARLKSEFTFRSRIKWFQSSLHEARPKIALQLRQMANKETYRVPSAIQQLNRVVCFMLASFVAFLGYYRLHEMLAPPFPVPIYFYWFVQVLAIMSPTCIAVAWLRLTGLKWPPALLLFVYVPVGFTMLWLIPKVWMIINN
jgi:hypothetical protein